MRTLALLLLAALPALAINESDSFKRIKQIAGPRARLAKTGDAKWDSFFFYVETPACKEKTFVFARGKTLDAMFAAWDARVSLGIFTTSNPPQQESINATVSGLKAASMRIELDGIIREEVFRQPEALTNETWQVYYPYNAAALAPGIHVYCPVFYGPDLPGPQGGDADMFRVAQ